ncbi:EF-hand domain-containing protein [Gimesia aquarii]|uniref:EF hand n=1 Tax=Gimesia aquarii TaxID=2527964 RepID=A0A517X0P2_9PLAN|nr:EF-hand domain-containing protein [Gimesia aquarii]QDU11075.1 EF hand [Gimesia aquarii]
MLAGEVRPEVVDDQHKHAAQRIVLLAPSAPFIIELSVLVDKETFRTTTTDYIDRLFRSLDRDQNNYIDLKEMENVPAFGIKQYDQGTPAQRMKKLEFPPMDNRLSLAEFASYLHSAQGTAFRITGTPSRTSQAIELFRKLDQNGDGSISDAEFMASSKTLFMYDRDEDEVFNVAELQPFGSDPNRVGAQPVVRQVVETPFRRLDNDQSIKDSISELFKKYVEHANAEKTALSVNCFKSGDPDAMARVQSFDRDSDGFLSHDELFVYLQNPVIDVQLQITLPRKQRFRPQLKLLKKQSNRMSEIEPVSNSKLKLRVDGLLLELRAKSSRHMFADNVRFYQTRFRVVDADKNGYLNQSEFMQLNIPKLDYKNVDQNKDDMLTVKELTDSLIKDTSAVQNQVVMTVQNDGKSLFEILDTDLDRRLSPRELQKSVQRVREYDGNRDRSLDVSELRGHFKLTFELGKPELFVFDPRMNSMAMGQGRAVQRTSSGPRWFQRMDRNRDGDISPREFLFDPSLFIKLDTNHDSLISPAEAEALKDNQQDTTN